MQLYVLACYCSILANVKDVTKRWCCRYEFQMQYGSIGWSVGATLGYAQSVPEKRVIACIGDGSFQVHLRSLFVVVLLNWIMYDFGFCVCR